MTDFRPGKARVRKAEAKDVFEVSKTWFSTYIAPLVLMKSLFYNIENYRMILCRI